MWRLQQLTQLLLLLAEGVLNVCKRSSEDRNDRPPGLWLHAVHADGQAAVPSFGQPHSIYHLRASQA